MSVQGAIANPLDVRIRVLGRFAVEVGSEPVNLPSQSQRVIGYLAVVRKGELRSKLAGHLWPLAPQRRADANLRTALWRIGQVLPGVVVQSRIALELRSGIEIDARVAADLANAVLRGQEAPSMRASHLWEDDLLPYWDEEWLVIERERFRQLRIHGLEAISRVFCAAGQLYQALDAALAAVAAEPLRESAHLAVVEAYLAEGNRSQADRHIESYRRLLHDELGLTLSDTFAHALRDPSSPAPR